MLLPISTLISLFSTSSISTMQSDRSIENISLQPEKNMEKPDGTSTESFTERMMGTPIRHIILHETACDFADSILALTGADVTLGATSSKRITPVSVQYLIPKESDLVDADSKTGKYLISMVNPETNIAYQAGLGSFKGIDAMNNHSIGIEIVNNGLEPFEPLQMDILTTLCKQILTTHHNLTPADIIAHGDFGAFKSSDGIYSLGRKQDVSSFFDWELFYSKMADKMDNTDSRTEGFRDLVAVFSDPIKETDLSIGEFQVHYDGDRFLEVFRSALTTDKLELIRVIAEQEGFGMLAKTISNVQKSIADGENPFQEPTMVIKLSAELLSFIGFPVYPPQGNEQNSLDTKLAKAVEAFNRHYATSIFEKEIKMIDGQKESKEINRRIFLQSFKAMALRSYAESSIKKRAHETTLALLTTSSSEENANVGKSYLT